MPDRILVSGPAGGGKSQVADALLADAQEPTVLADFQAVYVALTGVQRGPDGRYPLRDRDLLPVTEYVRQAIITGAVGRGLGVIVTNSDSRSSRRNSLLDRLGQGATERVVDPGEDVVRERLADDDGELSEACGRAIRRWYREDLRRR